MRRAQAFWWGYAAAIAIHSVWQDIIGKDAYLREVDSQWIPSWLTLPLGAIVLIYAAAELYRARRADREDRQREDR